MENSPVGIVSIAISIFTVPIVMTIIFPIGFWVVIVLTLLAMAIKEVK